MKGYTRKSCIGKGCVFCKAPLTLDNTDTYAWAITEPDMAHEYACDLCYIPF